MTSGAAARRGVRAFKPYPEYKDSGVEWLGEIPAHWDVKRVKHLAYIASGFAPPDSYDRSTGEYPVYGSNGLIGYCDDYLVSQETLAVGRVGASGSVNVVPARSWVSDNALLLRDLRPTARLPWLRYVLETMNLGTQAAKNAQPIITGTFLGNQTLATPPLDEQRAIAAFLDRETAKIDALVAKKERLIELLQEKRTALITQAVTCGLDPNVPMRDSGVEWLGEIPAHWDVKPAKRMFVNLDHRRIPLSSEERRRMAKEYPYYGASGVIDHVEDYLFDEPLVLVAEDGANLFSRSTPLAFVATGKYWVNNHAHILRPRDGMVNYWSHVLASVVFDPWITGSAQPKLTGENLGTIPLPIPPPEEREAILLAVEKGAGAIEALMSMIRDAIDRLKELRTALISAAVTGKIDVREGVA